MTEGAAYKIGERMMAERGLCEKDYIVRYRHLVLDGLEQRKLEGENNLFILIDFNYSIKITSKAGIYDALDLGINEQQHVHRGLVVLENVKTRRDNVRFYRSYQRKILKKMSEFDNIPDRDLQMRSNGTHVQTETYTPEAVERLKRKVDLFYQQGKRKYYAISVDGEIVVPRTYDTRKFNEYLTFVEPGVKTVEVKMYQGNSPNCNRYIYVLTAQLSGVGESKDVQSQIMEALKIQKLESELKIVQLELARKSKKYKRAKAELESLIDEFEEFKEKEKKSSKAKIASMLRDGVQLAGAMGIKLPGTNASFSGTPPKPESEVEVEIESDESDEADKTSKYESVLGDMEEAYGSENVESAIGIANIIAASPELQKVFKEQINQINKNQNG